MLDLNNNNNNNNNNEGRGREKPARRVHFSHIVTVHRLDDDEGDRRSEWMRYAVGRQRFNRRIAALESILGRHHHRTNMQYTN